MRRFDISGMNCAACSARVEKAASSVPGVTVCTVNLLTNSMSIEGTASDESIISAVTDAGYGCAVQNLKKPVDGETSKEDKETRLLAIRLVLSAVLTVAAMVFMHLGIKLSQIVLALAVMLINRRFFISGFKGVIHKAPNMDTLVALGSLASFIYGYYDSSAMILTLITVGKTLESRAKGKTTNALKALMKIVPETSISAGEEFNVLPGDKIPADAVVLSGVGTVDESMLTGESRPVEKTAGCNVSAGTTSLKGSLHCRATAVGEETVLSQIIRMVSDAASSKAPIARMADRVSAIFVPAVISIAVITAVIWLIIGKDTGFAISRGISVLVISCPCSLGLATPVAIMVASGKGARNGILFKTAASIEETGRIDTVVLDKTGTLTYGSESIRDLESMDSSSDELQKRANTLRPDSKQAVAELKKQGIEVWMLSGDHEERAKEIAERCGIENVMCQVLPGEKIDKVKELQSMGKKVVMVGDGINDGPALTQADVGMAIGNGTDVAIDAADIVLIKSSLADVPAAILLSRKTLKNIRENLFWAFFYNAVGIPIAAGALTRLGITLTPALASACMSLSSFCVVSNALRLNLLDMYLNGQNINEESNYAENTQNEKKTEEKTLMTTTLKVEGLMCPHCDARVKKALEAIPGVVSAEADHEKGTATANSSEEISFETLKAAIENEGYKVLE